MNISPSYFFTAPDATSTTHSFSATSVNRIFRESGDHDGVYGNDIPGRVIARASPCPSCGAIMSLYSPDASLNQLTDRPSGDQAGARSALALECVRLRTSPFSAGMVKISPRASTSARLPVGDSASALTRVETSFHCGIIQGKSPFTVTDTGADVPVFGSSRCNRPACSKMTTPAPDSIVLTSKSVKRVICVTAFDRPSYFHTFCTPSRSEMKYTSSPSQTGSSSFELTGRGIVSSANDFRSSTQMGLF